MVSPTRTALVTGASAGIGSALAHEFARHGWNLVITARREDRLRALARELEGRHGVQVRVLAADLADPETPARLQRFTEEAGLRIDGLVNNAGYGVPGAFRDVPREEHSRFLRVMVESVVELTHRYEPGMADTGFGRILNVASLAALLPGPPGHTLYAAAKAFLVRFSESLALEHTGDGVHVTALCPGFTYSEFHDVVGNRAGVSTLPAALWQTAEEVAREGFAAVMSGKVVHVTGWVNRAIAGTARLTPAPLLHTVLRRGARRLRVTSARR